MDLSIPYLLDTDSYKCTHWQMYPEAESMTAYFTCRGPLNDQDHRIVFAGFRYLFETVIARRITMDDIHEVDSYLATHGVAKTQFNWPRDLWVDVVEKHDGYLPFEIRALRDGSVIYPQVPCFTITARGKFSRLVTWFETALMRIWSPMVTATKSRHVWDGLKAAFDVFEAWRIRLSVQWDIAPPTADVISYDMKRVRDTEFAMIRDGQH